MEIKSVIQQANTLLEAQRYSSSRIYGYNWLWKKGILSYMNARGITEFDETVGADFIQTMHDGGTVTFSHRDLIKSVDVLINIVRNGTLGCRLRIRAQYPLTGGLAVYAQEYLESLKEKGINETKTIPSYRRMLSVFTEFLCSENIEMPSEIEEDIIVRFIESRHHRRREYVGQTRRFLKYLHTRGLLEIDYSYLLSRLGKNITRVKTPSFYSPDEIKQLEESISRTSNVGKRNYAMLVLCSRLGLRVSDVADLKLSDIDWENCVINKVQYKTGYPLSLPLLPIVGNAIIDYLRNARPKSTSNNVFLSCRPPYGEMLPGAVHSAIAVAFRESGVNYENRHHGGHALRFSLAQRMLDKSTPFPIISETLGHQSTDMTRTYVRIDINHMRQCVLDVPIVEDDFYTQRGGWFYD